jgi:hypothetical protein
MVRKNEMAMKMEITRWRWKKGRRRKLRERYIPAPIGDVDRIRSVTN